MKPFKDMKVAELKKALVWLKHTEHMASVAIVVGIGTLGILQGLAGDFFGAYLAIMGLVWFRSVLIVQGKNRSLSKRLLDSELSTALEEASTPTEIDANCKEIEHKIDVGYYQGH